VTKCGYSKKFSPLPFVFIISFMKKNLFSCHFSFNTTFPLIFMLGFNQMGWHLNNLIKLEIVLRHAKLFMTYFLKKYTERPINSPNKWENLLEK
jgi:hypothetical protein